MPSYEQYINGDLVNYSLTEDDIKKSMKSVPEM